MTWSFDLTTAPRGKTVTSARKVGNNTHEITDFVPDVIWLATKCGKVSRSYWIPESGKTPARWSGLATREEPVAWQAYIVPEHPHHQSDVGAFAAVKGKARLASAESVEPPASGLIVHKHIFLDDCGSGA
jgi:hypothetical protein